ncbi:MAG TPA: response regulator, partial [Terriglobales bacterium]|nr:response regulator [Terriglobales bacterium]
MARTGARPAADHHADSSLARILVAGHDKKTCALLRDYLEQNGYEVSTVASSISLQQCWAAAVPDLAILDSTLPDLPMLIPQLKARHPFVPLIMLAGADAIGLAAEALRLGAEQFLQKPFDLPVMAAVIQRHLDYQRLRRRHIAEKLTSRNLHPLAGECDAVRSLADLARKAALSDRPVVIQGERGTGKRLLASWLHENGRRASRPFIELNFGSLLRSGNERQDDTDLFDRREQRLAAFPG